MKIKRAIVSVSDKTGVVDFAKGLKELGVEILSTGGTAKTLRDAGVEVTEISEYTGSPEILDGRLKTLHPLVHGGILGMRENSKHKKEMAENNIKPIDMVVVNLYPFQETVVKPDCSLEDAVENIDIGGPTMLRAAAKNWKDVVVVVDPVDYGTILTKLRETNGEVDKKLTFSLAQKVFAHTAEYDSAICNYLNAVEDGEKKDIFPKSLGLTYEKVQDLRYGENPHQKASFYKEKRGAEPCVATARQLHGKELSYNNIMDADAVVEVVKEFDKDICAIVIKHANPCGAATSTVSPADAFSKAKATDPVSAFGGIVGFNREVDEETADAIKETFFEVIVAPKFSDAALTLLQKKKNVRLLELPGLESVKRVKSWNTRKVTGGLLLQERDFGFVNVRECDVPTKRKPSVEELKGLEFAWKICKHVKSNAIVFSSDTQLLGVGAGQMSRVDSVRIARMKMEDTKDRRPATSNQQLVLASDAFFPFRDGVDAAHEAGATAIIQPGGSVRDEEVIAAANEHNIAMVFTGMRHFKH